MRDSDCGYLRLSIYRTIKRTPQSDVHHVATDVQSPPRNGSAVAPQAREQDWMKRRKAQPATTLLPITIRWLVYLSPRLRPDTTSAAFPRIVNMLASLWSNTAAFKEYMNDLLVDRRGDRRGFPLEVLAELHRLHAHHEALKRDELAAWDRGSPNPSKSVADR